MGFAGGLALGAGTSQPVLVPGVLRVTLEKALEPSRPTVIYIDSGQLKNLRWIRVSCSGGGAYGVINLN